MSSIVSALSMMRTENKQTIIQV